MLADKVKIETLQHLEPLCALSEPRLGELAELTFVERVSQTLDPFRVRGVAGQMIYLIGGKLSLALADGRATQLEGGTPEARHPIGRKTHFASAKALTDIELLRIDDDLLDILMTWDQLAQAEGIHERATRDADAPSATNWAIQTGMFSIKNLQTGAFGKLPTAHISELMQRFHRVMAKRGEAVVREGAEGDYYYLLETGTCRVERMLSGAPTPVAELKPGDAFGEEALVANSRRNATVTMLTDGALLRLDKKDFHELLGQPLLQAVNMDQARGKIAAGAQWIDVRCASESEGDQLPGALNIPLVDLRGMAQVLDKEREYVTYCQTGRRSAAAAFLLAQRGFKAFVLDGGLRGGGAAGGRTVATPSLSAGKQ